MRGTSYRWAILAVSAGAQAALSALQQGLPSLGPALRDELGLSLAHVGIVLTSVTWGLMLLLLAWGWLADRFGERAVVAAGLAGSSLAVASAAFTHSTWTLVVALAAAGALGGSASIGGGSIIMRWFQREQRGLALGIRQMAVPLGGAAAALSLPLLVDAGGLPAALLTIAAAEAAAAIAAATWIRQPPPSRRTPRPRAGAPPLRDGRIWRLSIGSALLVCAQVAILTFAVLFLHDHRGVAAGRAAGALAAMQLGGAVARLVAGRSSDRRGRRIAPLRRLGLAAAVAVAATAALTDAALVALVPVLVAAGILSNSWNGLAFTATAEIAGRERAGMAIGLEQTVMRAFSTVAGVGFGVIVTVTSWPMAFALLSLVPLAGWGVLRPLAGDEERRIRERERHLAAPA